MQTAVMVMPMELEKHYKLKELADELNVSVRTLRRWIDAGKLAAVQVGEGKGSELFVPISELIRLGFRVKKSDE